MINEINRGNGITQLVEWPDQMEVKRIHVRRKHQVEESPLDDILFILGIALFSVLLCFGIPILQASELLYVSIMAGMVACMMYVAYRSGTKRGR